MTDQTTADSAETIDALSDTLYDALYAITPFAEQHFADEGEGLRNAVRAVLEQAAVLPAITNHDTDTGVTPPPALTEEGRLRARVQVLEEDAERDQGLAATGARCLLRGHQGQIESGHAVIEGHRFALSTKLGLGTDASWDAIHERVAELRRVADETAATADFQDRGEAARLAQGIDGTAGDAQDIPHRYVPDEPALACLLCGLSSTYRKHTPGGVQHGETRPSTPPCAHCTHPQGDHDGRADHRAKHSPLVAGEPWCHACNMQCDYAAGARQDGAQP
ncbi:hypothetical protein ACH4GE_24500 [Streptomyces tendae]|uniref:hypothetical protein n=1 Tax=Streptomyces tendae TaxID=1932 RepID=UPI0037B9AE3F